MEDLTTQEVKDAVQYEENDLLARLIEVLENKHESYEVLEYSTSSHLRVELDEEDLYIIVDSENAIYNVENGVKVEVDLDELK